MEFLIWFTVAFVASEIVAVLMAYMYYRSKMFSFMEVFKIYQILPPVVGLYIGLVANFT